MKPEISLFSASWCAPCQTLRPNWTRLSVEEKDKATFSYVDVTDDMSAAKAANVQSVPTIIVRIDGQEVNRLHDITIYRALKKALSKYLS